MEEKVTMNRQVWMEQAKRVIPRLIGEIQKALDEGRIIQFNTTFLEVESHRNMENEKPMEVRIGRPLMISVVIDTGHETEIKSETIEELNKKREEGS